MKIVSKKCPNCNANLTVEPGQTIHFCTFCGAQLFEEEDFQSTYTYNYNYSESKIHGDAAKIKREEIKRDIFNDILLYLERKKKVNYERKRQEQADYIKQEKEKTPMQKAMPWIGFFIFIAICIGLAVSVDLYYSAKDQEQIEAGMLRTEGSEYYEGKHYKSVTAQLESIGFTDITQVDLNDDDENKNLVSTITIGGKSKFYSRDFFYPSDKVVITYH